MLHVLKKKYKFSVQCRDNKTNRKKNLGNMIEAMNNSVHNHAHINAIVKTLYCTVPCSSMPKLDLHVHVDHTGLSVIYEMNVYSN